MFRLILQHLNCYHMRIKSEFADAAAAATTTPKSVLEAFENIVEVAHDSGLPDDLLNATGKFAAMAPQVEFAANILGLTKSQAVLLSLFVDRCDDNSIRLPELANYCGCRNTRILRLAKEVDVLEDKHYVRASRSSSCTSYRVPQCVVEAISHDQAYVHTTEPVTDLRSFFDHFAQLMDERENGEITYDKLKTNTIGALADIADSDFGKKMRKFDLDDDDTVLAIFMMSLFVENNDDNIGFRDIDDLYDNNKIPSWVKYGLSRRTSVLFACKIIENTNDNGMARSDAFKITESAKEDLLAEVSHDLGKRSNTDLETHDKFAPKKLIYNDDEGRQVDELREILGADRFAGVQARLDKAGMRKGFCCLFYGSPGTGKTETVYQLARATGRDILRVDVDKIKSCWVGESEKNIKKLFDRYRAICRDSALAPILLFNEADAVLGVRLEGASSAVDKMENSIQNIILQEMESLDGIMIATTNLTTNLDKAFERRFLYKIRFNRPTLSMRSKIWQAMMPSLEPSQAAAIAARYDLSGGQIENVVRRHTVNSILRGSEVVDIEAILEACRHECISADHSKPVGFAG